MKLGLQAAVRVLSCVNKYSLFEIRYPVSVLANRPSRLKIAVCRLVMTSVCRYCSCHYR